MQQKDFRKIEKKNNICINVFCYEIGMTFLIYASDQKLENSTDLLPANNGEKFHYVCIKDFSKIMIHKTKNRNKKHFCKSCSQCFSSKNVLTEHKEACLSINGAQSVKLGKQTIEFKYYFKRIPVPFKIYADFESNIGSVESYEGFYSKKYQDLIP